MASSNKNLHITLDERRIIETGIHNGSTRTYPLLLPLSPLLAVSILLSH